MELLLAKILKNRSVVEKDYSAMVIEISAGVLVLAGGLVFTVALAEAVFSVPWSALNWFWLLMIIVSFCWIPWGCRFCDISGLLSLLWPSCRVEIFVLSTWKHTYKAFALLSYNGQS